MESHVTKHRPQWLTPTPVLDGARNDSKTDSHSSEKSLTVVVSNADAGWPPLCESDNTELAVVLELFRIAEACRVERLEQTTNRETEIMSRHSVMTAPEMRDLPTRVFAPAVAIAAVTTLHASSIATVLIKPVQPTFNVSATAIASLPADVFAPAELSPDRAFALRGDFPADVFVAACPNLEQSDHHLKSRETVASTPVPVVLPITRTEPIEFADSEELDVCCKPVAQSELTSERVRWDASYGVRNSKIDPEFAMSTSGHDLEPIEPCFTEWADEGTNVAQVSVADRSDDLKQHTSKEASRPATSTTCANPKTETDSVVERAMPQAVLRASEVRSQPQFGQAVRLTREALGAWMDVLRGPTQLTVTTR
jgi:hypothetical protein